MSMPEQDDQSAQERTPEHELPEAFTMNLGQGDAPQQKGNQVTSRTSTGLDVVKEGSEESFPGSDPPAVSNPTALSSEPEQPQ